jgi:hypothetical protein
MIIGLIKVAFILLKLLWIVACLAFAVVTARDDHPIYRKLPLALARFFQLAGILFAAFTLWYFSDTFKHRSLGLDELELNLLSWCAAYPVWGSLVGLVFVVAVCAYCFRTGSSEAFGCTILGNLLSRLGANEIGLPLLRHAIRLHPKLARAHVGILLADLARLDWDQTCADGASALSFVPDLAFAHVASGIAHYKKGEAEQAVRDLTTGLRLESGLGQLLPTHIEPDVLEKLSQDPSSNDDTRSATSFVLGALFRAKLNACKSSSEFREFARRFVRFPDANDVREQFASFVWRRELNRSTKLAELRLFVEDFTGTTAARLAVARAGRIDRRRTRPSMLFTAPSRGRIFALLTATAGVGLISLGLQFAFFTDGPVSVSRKDSETVSKPELSSQDPPINAADGRLKVKTMAVTVENPQTSEEFEVFTATAPPPPTWKQVKMIPVTAEKTPTGFATTAWGDASPSTAGAAPWPSSSALKPAWGDASPPTAGAAAPWPSIAIKPAPWPSKSFTFVSPKEVPQKNPQVKTRARTNPQVAIRDLPELTIDKMNELKTYDQLINYLGQPSRVYDDGTGHTIVEYNRINPGGDKFLQGYSSCWAKFDFYTLDADGSEIPLHKSSQDCSWNAPTSK